MTIRNSLPPVDGRVRFNEQAFSTRLFEEDPGRKAVIMKSPLAPKGGAKKKGKKGDKKPRKPGSVWKTPGGRWGVMGPQGRAKYFKTRDAARAAGKAKKAPEKPKGKPKGAPTTKPGKAKAPATKPAPKAPTDPGRKAMIGPGVGTKPTPAKADAGRKAVAPGSLTPDQLKQLRKAAVAGGLRPEEPGKKAGEKPAEPEKPKPKADLDKAIQKGMRRSRRGTVSLGKVAPKKGPSKIAQFFRGLGARAKGAAKRAAQSAGDRLHKLAASKRISCSLQEHISTSETALVYYFGFLDACASAHLNRHESICEGRSEVLELLPEMNPDEEQALYQFALTRFRTIAEVEK